MKKINEDVNHEDGGHLNDNGNKIYGELTALGMLRIINDQKKTKILVTFYLIIITVVKFIMMIKQIVLFQKN